MTDLLEQAFAQASRLPPPEQDLIADWLLNELKSETRWEETFSHSQAALSKLGSEALDEHRQGDTRELDADRL